MSFLSFFQKNFGEVIAIFDIDTAGLWGALLFLKENQKPKILSFKRITISLSVEDVKNSENLNTAIINNFKKLLDFLNEENLSIPNNKKNIDEVFVFLSSPLIYSGIRKVSLRNSGEIKIDKKVLKHLLEKNTEEFLKDTQFITNPKVVEQHITKAELNGYRTDNIFQSTKTLDLSVFNTVVSKNCVQMIERAILSKWGTEQVYFSSFTFAFSEAVKIFLKDSKTSLVVKVAGEATEVFVLKEGEVGEVINISLGINYLIRAISKRFEVPIDVSFSFFKIFVEDLGNKDLMEEVKLVLDKEGEKWGELFYEKTNRLIKESPASLKNIFIISPWKSENIYSKILKSIFPKNTPEIKKLDQEKILNFIDFDKRISETDISVAVAGLFLSKNKLDETDNF